MKQFTILKNTFDDEFLLLDVFKSLVGNRVELKKEEEYLIFFYEYENQEDVCSLFISFGNENVEDILGYVSSSKLDVYDEVKIALSILSGLPAGMYDLKTALLNAKGVKNKKQILDLILYSSGIDEDFIKKFVSNDLNVSKASKNMYIHRNTLNYKLDKLKELSGFDLRVFLDSYILYNLILG